MLVSRYNNVFGFFKVQLAMCGSLDPIAPIDNAGLAERIQKNMRGITPTNGAPCERRRIKRTMERRNITRLIPPQKCLPN